MVIKVDEDCRETLRKVHLVAPSVLLASIASDDPSDAFTEAFRFVLV